MQPYTLRITKDGRWFYNDREIIHPRVLRIFNDNLSRGKDGKYYLDVEGDTAEVTVDDAPFIVTRVSAIFDGGEKVGFLITLSDESEELLILDSIEINKENVPYCAVKGNLLARFSSQAYYMLADHIEYDEAGARYFIKIRSKEYDVSYEGGLP